MHLTTIEPNRTCSLPPTPCKHNTAEDISARRYQNLSCTVAVIVTVSVTVMGLAASEALNASAGAGVVTGAPEEIISVEVGSLELGSAVRSVSGTIIIAGCSVNCGEAVATTGLDNAVKAPLSPDTPDDTDELLAAVVTAWVGVVMIMIGGSISDDTEVAAVAVEVSMTGLDRDLVVVGLFWRVACPSVSALPALTGTLGDG
jgi:hypothetical protein